MQFSVIVRFAIGCGFLLGLATASVPNFAEARDDESRSFLEFDWDTPIEHQSFNHPVRIQAVGRDKHGVPILRGLVEASDGPSALVVTRGLDGVAEAGPQLIFVEKIYEQKLSHGANPFEFSVPLRNSEGSSVRFCLIDAAGVHSCFRGTLSLQKRLDSEGFVEVKKDHSSSLPEIKLDVGASLTRLDYVETRSSRLDLLHVTPKVGLTAPLGEKWALSVGGYFNLLPVGSGAGEGALQVLGLNLRAGYRLPLPWERLTVQVFGGVYYITTFYPGDLMGFKDLAGPQIYPALNWRISGDWSIYAYGKYSPVQAGFDQAPDFANNELSAGMGLRWKTHSVQFDYSQIHVDFSGIYVMDANSFSVGFSERF